MAKTVAEAAASEDTSTEVEELKDTKERIQAFAATASRLKTEADEVRGELGAAYKDAEKDWNLNKGMFKWAHKLANQGSAKGQANLRDFLRYCQYLGVTDQKDFFDDVAA